MTLNAGMEMTADEVGERRSNLDHSLEELSCKKEEQYGDIILRKNL